MSLETLQDVIGLESRINVRIHGPFLIHCEDDDRRNNMFTLTPDSTEDSENTDDEMDDYMEVVKEVANYKNLKF